MLAPSHLLQKVLEELEGVLLPAVEGWDGMGEERNGGRSYSSVDVKEGERATGHEDGEGDLTVHMERIDRP
jgi:hypothetical protein